MPVQRSLAHSLALPCDCIRSLADRAPQEFYDLYPPAEQIAVAEEQQFPTDQNLTGLAWFSCKAEGAEYPIADAFTPYPKSVQQDLRRAYYASVSFTDHNIGQLLATVDALGLTDELVVVFHADHGYQLGERNIYCKETNFNLAACGNLDVIRNHLFGTVSSSSIPPPHAPCACGVLDFVPMPIGCWLVLAI